MTHLDYYMYFLVLHAEVSLIDVRRDPLDDPKARFLQHLREHKEFAPCWEAVGAMMGGSVEQVEREINIFASPEIFYDFKKKMKSAFIQHLPEEKKYYTISYRELPTREFPHLNNYFVFERNDQAQWDRPDETEPPVERAVFASNTGGSVHGSREKVRQQRARRVAARWRQS